MTMALTEILVLLGIVAVFATFGIVLAWGQYQTTNLPRTPEAEAKAPDTQDDVKLAA
jgi:hypothetical protein